MSPCISLRVEPFCTHSIQVPRSLRSKISSFRCGRECPGIYLRVGHVRQSKVMHTGSKPYLHRSSLAFVTKFICQGRVPYPQSGQLRICLGRIDLHWSGRFWRWICGLTGQIAPGPLPRTDHAYFRLLAPPSNAHLHPRFNLLGRSFASQ